MANNRMTSQDIRALLFDDERHLITNTQLLEMLKQLIEDTEGMVHRRLRDLEWPYRSIVRVRQLLKANIPVHGHSPYHVFLSKCLDQTREMVWVLERLLGKMRTTHWYLL